jgi:cytochrome c oxidase assembly protein subunit 15
VLASFCLLALGAVVTTFHVGMADPIWPTYPWHLLLVSWDEPRPGFLVEHSHRLAGYVVGCCVIVLAVGLWRDESRRGLRWLGVAALAGVIVQGLLGGFRVKLDQMLGPNLALVHGCFAQVVFALLVCLASLLSSSGVGAGAARPARAFQRLAVVTPVLVYLQIVFGSLLRHTYSTAGQRGHLLAAFAVAVAVALLTREYFAGPAHERGLGRSITLLAVLVAVQLVLGVEAWMSKYFATDLVLQAATRTLHVLVGFLVFAISVVVAVNARRSIQAVVSLPQPVRSLEGAA